uniref:Flagellar biosynthesis protein FlhF n=1 Tax=Schlesneria paludicola TaxID=360056 RepID=A0A7C4QMZ7_9PLAN
MNTDIRTFKAESLQAALDIVHRELGQDAVILNTRQIDKPRIWPWSPRRQEVEITARREVAPRQPLPLSARDPRGRPESELAPPPTLLEPTTHKRHNVTPPKWSPNDVIPDDAIPAAMPKASLKAVNRLAGTQQLTVAARARNTPPAAAPALDAAAVNERLDQLQRMILELGRERRRHTLHDVPSELFHFFTELIDADVDDELARELVCRARQLAEPAQLRDPAAVWALLTGLLERELKIAGPIKPVRGRRKVAALVGPTGVGKTTTIAKLAANFHVREGVKLGLVTVDTYRIAAVEQLKTYAEIIQLPMKVVTTPLEMRRALDELAGLDLVLIDTAGRSPQDELRIQELQQFLQAAQADEVHLVLSLTSSRKSLAQAVASFQPAGATSLIATKLDEAPGASELWQLCRQGAPPISYLTTGQDVPDDIEPAHATRLAKLILGREQLHHRA